MTVTPRFRVATWAGYAACAWGLIFAGISFYWAAGGTLGLDTIGGSLEQLGRAQDVRLRGAVLGTGFLKLAAALLALALVSPSARRLPRRLVLLLARGAAALLTIYGGVLVTVEALVASGALKPATPVDWKALYWHLWLWDMSFLVWGLLFGLATWHHARTPRQDSES